MRENQTREQYPQKKKQTEEKAKVVAAVWGLTRTHILGGIWGWVWCNQMIIYFSAEASILPSVRSSIRPFLQIILGLNL